MSFVKSVERGINSATYNPEAEKALREEKKLASEARKKYRDALFSLREKKSQMIQEKKASEYYMKAMDTVTDDGFKWIRDNPDAELQAIVDKAQDTNDKVQEIVKTNVIVLALSILPQFYRTVASTAFLNKQIKEDKKKAIDAFADSLEAWVKTTPTLTSQDILVKQQQVELEAKEVLEGTGESTPAVTSADSAAALKKKTEAEEEVVKKEEEADKNTFKWSRLFTETYRIAASVVGSLFIVMLILVSGMLTANDAIGRDNQYRVLYFIFGGLGFPVMLVYYLYRWFFGTGPHIYRLLPLYTKESDTALGRFFMFPFTYTEDQAAKDAKTKFMKEAAELVGKKYTPPADAAGAAAGITGKLGGLVEKLQDLTLAPTKGVNTILEGIQGLKLSSGTKQSVERVLEKMEKLNV